MSMLNHISDELEELEIHELEIIKKEIEDIILRKTSFE